MEYTFNIFEKTDEKIATIILFSIHSILVLDISITLI